MTKITRSKPRDSDDENIVRFRVYRSTKDKTTVLGYFSHDYQSGPSEATFAKSDYGVPVEKAFAETKAYADAKSVSYLWVDDPDGLFPESGEN